MAKTDTPRTDAEKYTVQTAANYGMGDEYDEHVVDVEFARALERELDALQKKHSDFVETTGLMLEAIGYREEYALQWPKEKASVTFKRWFDEQRASHRQALRLLTQNEKDSLGRRAEGMDGNEWDQWVQEKFAQVNGLRVQGGSYEWDWE